MRGSLVHAARMGGLGAADIGIVARAYDLAMEPRTRALEDDHHPAYLHPGRSPLVLLRDVGPVAATVLAASAVHDTEDMALRVGLDRVRDDVDPGVAELVASLPLPGDERLLERLVTLDEGARLAALAERLDQLRHLHLREDLAPLWAAHHEEAGAVWGPVAERTHPRLATRIRHWHGAFARRLETRAAREARRP